MIRLMENRKIKIMIICLLVLLFVALMVHPAYATDVSTVIESAWKSAETQIKNVVNNVLFPVIDLILAVFFFVKLGMAYFDYRKQGQFEWTAPAILFGCLCFTLIAPNYVWNIL